MFRFGRNLDRTVVEAAVHGVGVNGRELATRHESHEIGLRPVLGDGQDFVEVLAREPALSGRKSTTRGTAEGSLL